MKPPVSTTATNARINSGSSELSFDQSGPLIEAIEITRFQKEFDVRKMAVSEPIIDQNNSAHNLRRSDMARLARRDAARIARPRPPNRKRDSHMIPSLFFHRLFRPILRRADRLLPRLLLLTGLIAGAHPATAADDRTITIGVNNWAENIAVANLWKALLAQKGYTVSLRPGDKAIIYSAVAQGKLDLTFEVWLPSADAAPYDSVKSRVEKIGPWFPRAQLGLAVPDYVDVDSVDQLNARAAQFQHDGKPMIFGIEPGSGLMKLTAQARTAYGLDYTVLPSSEAAMLLALERAAKRREPIVVTLWNPHWVWAKYPMHYLKDPKQVFGQPDAIYAIATAGFGRAHPDISHWLGAWKMDDQTLGSLMNDIRAEGDADPQKGVARWIAANRERVDAWLR
ncbi:glycine betaine ABC transporter substrate-binding protein [Burkholderia sp. SIMBA_062]|uniref:glycine betaine ABC transporter substrate-binding protein n=1 Tax=Burkholderia sp. SIMBA_062 TaxID=3085803 RepID=UPI00397988F8